MKLGLDIHGVIDSDWELFRNLTRKLLIGNGPVEEIHIITGVVWTTDLEQELKDRGVVFTHSFSITDHHRLQGTPIIWKDAENPFIDDIIWDATKAQYCRRNRIGIHIDDTPRYGDYFRPDETQFIIYNQQVRDFLKATI